MSKKLSKHTIVEKPNPDHESFNDRLRSLAFWSYNLYKKSFFKPVLTEEEKSALKTLSKNKSIIITRPDKGNGVVLLDKEEYIHKVNVILSDSSKFELVDKEDIKILFTLETKINNFLLGLKKKVPHLT